MMNLETRLNKLEQATGACKEGVHCACPVNHYVVGSGNISDFYAKHPPCGKPIDTEAVRDPGSFETRVLLPIYEKPAHQSEADYAAYMAEQHDRRTRPAADGVRLFLRDFS